MKTTQRYIRSIMPVMLFMLAAGFLSSCKKSGGENPDIAALNVVNAVAGPTTINFNLNGALISGPVLPYPQSTGYFTTYTGIQKLEIMASGTTPVLATANLDMDKDGYYSVFFTGTSTSYSTVIATDNTSLPASGKAKIRFINLSPDAPSLNLTNATGTIIVSNQTYKEVSDYVTIDPMAYNFQIRNTTGGGALVSADKTIEAGKVYTIFVSGLVAGAGNTALGIQVQTNI